MYQHGNVYRYIPVLIVEGKRCNGKPIILGQKSDLGGALRAYAKIVARPTSVTTLGEAMTVYEHGPEFADLKPSTQQDYRYILGNSFTAFAEATYVIDPGHIAGADPSTLLQFGFRLANGIRLRDAIPHR